MTTQPTTTIPEILADMLAYEREAFETDADVSGADLVDAFAAWRQQIKAALAIAPTPQTDLMREAEQALDVLAGDVEDTFPARAEDAADLAMRIRSALAAVSEPSEPPGLMAAVRALYEACGEEGSEEEEAISALPADLNEALAEVIRYGSPHYAAPIAHEAGSIWQRLAGHTFTAEEGEEENAGFYAIWANNQSGGGAELAAGIGEPEVAALFVEALTARLGNAPDDEPERDGMGNRLDGEGEG